MIWEGAPKSAMELVSPIGVGISKLCGMSRRPSSLRSLAAQGVLSITSSRIMSTTQMASLSESISSSALGGLFSSSNHPSAFPGMWGFSVSFLLSHRDSIRGLWGPCHPPRRVAVVCTEGADCFNQVAPVNVDSHPEFPYAPRPNIPVRMYARNSPLINPVAREDRAS